MTGDIVVRLSRRGFLRHVTGALAGVALPVFLGAACTPAAPAAPTAAPQGQGNVLPAYVPLANKPKPDLPSKGPLLEDAYLNYPANPTTALPAAAPGLGSTVTSLVLGLYPPATPVEQNTAWQAVNKALNATVQFTVVPFPDYAAKLGTLMASNASDLPDIVNFFGTIAPPIGTTTAAPNVPAFLQKSMADLTPYLGGDAIKDYPNLAAIPTFAWKNSGSVLNGHIYLVPLERPAPGMGQLFKNASIYDKVIGADYVPKNADDFKRVLQALTQPSNNLWGSAGFQGNAYYLSWYIQLFGAPNNWAQDSTGKLVKDIETPQYKEAVGYVRDLVTAGIMHPDSPTIAGQTAYRDVFLGGKFAVGIQAFGNNWFDIWSRGRKQNPPASFVMIDPFPAHDGARPVDYLGGGFNSGAALKPASPERIKELLRVMNWLAAPFGSKEDLLLTYGLAETHYKLDSDGNPIPTDAWAADVNNVPWRYTVQHPQVIYYAGAPDFVKVEYQAEQVLVQDGVQDPTLGYYSPTANSKGVLLGNAVTSTLDDIAAGRRPLSDYDQMVQDWRQNGGDQIRTEFSQAITSAR